MDFTQARLLDRNWWRQLRLKLLAMDRRNRAQGLSAYLQFHLALVSNGGLTADSFTKSQEAARETLFDLLGALRPWEGKGYLDRRRSEFRGYRQAYIDNFGVDPLDPAFQKWEAHQVQKLLAGELDEPTPDADEEARLTQRLQSRMLKA